MAQFKGGKYSENGVLSYNYLGGKGGKGKGGVSIKKRGDSWYFVDEQGKVKNALGNGGKLTPTHMQNLERDGIFENAKVNSKTGGKLSSKQGSGPKGGYSAKAGANVGIGPDGTLSDGSASVQATPLAESKYSLAKTQGVRPAPQISSNTQEAVVSQVAPDRTISGVRSSFSDMADGSAVSDGTFTTSNFGGEKPMGIGDNYALPSSTPKQSSYGGNEWQDKNPRGYGSFNPDGPGYRFTKEGAEVEPYASESSMTVAPGNNNMITAPSASGWSDMSNAGPPGVEIQSTGFGGRPETPVGGNVFNTAQDSTTPGITDKKDGGWGAADWNAAGSVMKGVGGLASAWTGAQNYQLARDAHNAQKNQWQANYDQQLEAYKDNKVMANNEIAARNRTLKARGQAESYKTI